MNSIVKLVLPYPPSTNAMWKTVRPKGAKRARVIASPIANEYKAVVAEMAARCVARVWTGPVRLELDVFRPRKAGDLSNTLKVLEDALRGVVFADDNQTVEIIMRRWESPGYPRVQVTAEEMSAEEFERMQRGPGAWAIPVGWTDANQRLEAVREKERTRDKARAAKKTLAQAAPSLSSLATSAYTPGKGRRRG